MSASVLLCTYEGARYLEAQLDSLRQQTVAPCEVVAVDDGSSDATMAILRSFASSAPFPVAVHQNAERLGPTGNFARAWDLARGDVILFCDQDDVWYPEKVGVVAERFRADPDLGCAFADAALVDADGEPLGGTLWASLGFGSRERRRFEAGEHLEWLLRRTIAFGATMAVRRELHDVVTPVPMPFGHDNCAAIAAAALYRVEIVDRPLGAYRQHGSQVSSAVGSWRDRLSPRSRPRNASIVPEASSLRALADRLEEHRERAVDRGVHRRWVRELRAKADHLFFRASLPQRAPLRAVRVALELGQGRYRRYSNSWLSAAKDLLPR